MVLRQTILAHALDSQSAAEHHAVTSNRYRHHGEDTSFGLFGRKKKAKEAAEDDGGEDKSQDTSTDKEDEGSKHPTPPVLVQLPPDITYSHYTPPLGPPPYHPPYGSYYPPGPPGYPEPPPYQYGRFDPAMTDQLADMIAMKVQSRLGMGMPPMGTGFVQRIPAPTHSHLQDVFHPATVSATAGGRLPTGSFADFFPQAQRVV
mmetsp:Transcript_54491/g.127292  ORF Transcript_54491/g.127292 Transcript_54491/m.127292 type:complete len:203 (+) Transcript_54491:75-683(+)